jgi:hypothetical protein
MANRETAISESDLLKIIHLLRSEELTISEIARRTHFSKAVIASIKRRLDLQKTRGSRTPVN